MRKANTYFLKDIRVLVVDNSSTALQLIKQQLISLGVKYEKIVTVERYQNAIKAVETHQFNVIIIDYHLDQYLTGYELAMLLYRNRLISQTTGVLMISGDARQETVLTALSGKVRHFITKPLSNDKLAAKLFTIHSETQKLQQIAQAIQAGHPVSAASLFELINRSGFSVSLEAFLLEHWMSQNNWALVDMYITMSSTQAHPAKMCAVAHLLHRDNNTLQAIEELHQFLTENPLSIRVMDTLSQLYAESDQLINAAYWATKAFELTPSIGERASKASQLNASANKRNALLKIGHTYAQHMSLVDVNWLKSVIQHFHSLVHVFPLTESLSAKTEILQHANKFVYIASRKLTKKRKKQLDALHQLFQSHILIDQTNDSLAHSKLMQSIANFYDELFECPLILLMEYLPALELFGEQEIRNTLVRVLNARGANLQQLGRCKQATLLHRVNSSNLWETNTDLVKNEVLLEHYPYSSEAKIQYLHNYNEKTNTGKTKPRNNKKMNRIITELMTLDLPPNWKNWVITGRENNFSVIPPSAFSLSTFNRI